MHGAGDFKAIDEIILFVEVPAIIYLNAAAIGVHKDVSHN